MSRQPTELIVVEAARPVIEDGVAKHHYDTYLTGECCGKVIYKEQSSIRFIAVGDKHMQPCSEKKFTVFGPVPVDLNMTI